MSLEFEVGELKGRMVGFDIEVKDMKDKISKMDSKLNTILDYISQTKGGWKATTMVLSLSGIISAFVSFIVKRIL